MKYSWSGVAKIEYEAIFFVFGVNICRLNKFRYIFKFQQLPLLEIFTKATEGISLFENVYK